jgi:uncharacterized membrane protein
MVMDKDVSKETKDNLIQTVDFDTIEETLFMGLLFAYPGYEDKTKSYSSDVIISLGTKQENNKIKEMLENIDDILNRYTENG